MSLLTNLITENTHILSRIYFIFLKRRPRPNLKVFQYQIWTLSKDWERSNQVRPLLAILCQLVSLILTKKCVIGLRVTQIVKFEGVWGVLDARISFQ